MYVALLRGINVGGNNKLPMKDLAAMVTAAGGKNVSTYIASGNVIFDAPAATARKLPAALARAIRDQLGLTVPVVLRTADELAATIAANPYADEAAANHKRVNVMFLADLPAAAAVKALDPRRSPPDEFTVIGRDIYLCFAEGAADTKLTNAWFDAQLKTVSTARNWRTVLTLRDMATK